MCIEEYAVLRVDTSLNLPHFQLDVKNAPCVLNLKHPSLSCKNQSSTTKILTGLDIDTTLKDLTKNDLLRKMAMEARHRSDGAMEKIFFLFYSSFIGCLYYFITFALSSM